MKIVLDRYLIDQGLPALPRHHASGAAMPVIVDATALTATAPFAVTAMRAEIVNADGVTLRAALVNSRTDSSLWSALLDAASFAHFGEILKGVKIYATIGEDAEALIYTADLVIYKSAADAQPGHGGGEGDISHADFSGVDPETVSVYELARILKGEANG